MYLQSVIPYHIILLLCIICGANNLWSQLQPNEVSGLQLWLRADQGVVLNGIYVSQWTDGSGLNNHATSAFDVIRPTVFQNAINGLPAIRFDGVEDFLEFPLIQDVRTVFWVLRESAAAGNAPPRPLLGWSGGFNFLRGDQRQFWNGQFASPAVVNGTTRLNFSPINGATQTVPNQFSIVTLRTTAPVQATHITMELNIFGRTWWGDIAELLIYNEPLSDTQIQGIETYLANKYAPAPEPMADVYVDYGFCPTSICAPEGFESYQWSDGPNTACREVTLTGSYALQMTDVFGRTFNDTVSVFYPGNTAVTDAIICQGDAWTWDLNLNEELYNIQLNDGPVNSVIELNTAGTYSLTVIDNNQCQLEKSFQIEIDSFPQLQLLGSDTTLCSGNTIAPIIPLSALASWHWSDGSIVPNLMIESTGLYWLEAVNTNGCSNRDSIQIIIAGAAPEISFSYNLLCSGNSAQFVGIAGNSNITQWLWNFNGMSEASGQQVLHTFDSPGMKSVQLTVIASTGCSNTLVEPVLVNPIPSVSFSNSNACVGSPTLFTDNSTITTGSISSYQWFINGESYDVANPIVTFSTAGFKNIIHAAISSAGCTAETSTLIEVKGAPEASWTAPPTCLGTLTTFTPVVNSPNASISSYAWNFGDGTVSTLANPNHFYPLAGSYTVQFSATNQFGCIGTTNATHLVLALPDADFLISNACLGQPYTLQDLSSSNAIDAITQWQWFSSTNSTAVGQNPEVIFNTLGLNSVILTVTTQNGCTATRQKQIPVWPVPVASFLHDPLIGEAPILMDFTNTSTGATSAQWYFGDTYESAAYNTEHEFTLNGTFYTQLIVSNQFGCRDTTGRIITIARPESDIRLSNVTFTETPNGTQINVDLINTGNITLDQIIMSWQVGNDAPVLEIISGQLLPGQLLNYTFNSLFQKVGQQFPYICIEAEISPINYPEANLTDNVECKPLKSGDLEVFPPFPNPGDDRMFIRFITPALNELDIKVYDQSGKICLQFSDTELDKGFHQFFIDISSLSNGHYKLVLQSGNQMSSVSFIKLHRE